MSTGCIMRLCSILITFLIIHSARPQQPFDLDTTFCANFNSWYVNSVLPMPDGKILLSGQIHYPGDLAGSFRSSVKLLPNGDFDTSFPNFPQTGGGGPFRPWNDEFMYVQAQHFVRRLTVDGYIDPTFTMHPGGLYFLPLQGGDYHVYPDGRILFSGTHMLFDSIRGFTGLHCLSWFSNEGYLDTTKHHRTCYGSLDYFQELPDGKFIGTGSTSIWDGQPASNIIRFHANGALDTTFRAHVWWGQAYGFLPLEDGRIYASGLFQIEGITDTLHLVRFMPDGSLDPTFNNLNKFRVVEFSHPGYGATPGRIYQLADDQLLILGAFENVEDQIRRGIAVLDTIGILLEHPFTNAGVGNFTYQGYTASSTDGIIQAADGNWYIWGAYHGYNDGTVNDAQQRFISRLHGIHVGVHENEGTDERRIKIYPNPAQELVTFELELSMIDPEARMVVEDLQGRILLNKKLDVRQVKVHWNTADIPTGTYVVRIQNGKHEIKAEKLSIQR